MTESAATVIDLSVEEQTELDTIGRRLAKGTDRYGKAAETAGSLIHCHRIDAKRGRVRVLDAVGIVATPTLQLNVAPKIPTDHLLHLLIEGETIPRLASGAGALAESDNLAVLVATWFVSALERVLEEGLARDYRPHRDELATVRGRVDLLDTARLYYRGRLAIVAEVEEFDFDTPLNRILRHAARLIAAAVPLPAELRRRALRAIKHMDGVTDLRPADLAATVDRRTAHYNDALTLARQMLKSTGRTLDVGQTRSWTFLFRTPGPVENGIRAILQQGLQPKTVRKRALPLEGSAMTINPDLVFEHDEAVGDVKYKLAGAEWTRSDLYEVVAFAAAARTNHASIVTFRRPSTPGLPDVHIGDYAVREISWPVDESVEPAHASAELVARTQEWLATLSTTTQVPA